MFPPVESADEFGVLCWGGEITPATLTAAYHQGIFPWPHRGMPDAVVRAAATRAFVVRRASRRLAFAPFFAPRQLRNSLQQRLRCRHRSVRRARAWSRAFGSAVRGSTTRLSAPTSSCTGKVTRTASKAWQEGELVGGLYGVSWGGYFAGESMFYRRDGASKAALIALVERLREREVSWLDCEVMTPHFEAIGAREVRRAEFMPMLDEALNQPVRLFDDQPPAPTQGDEAER